MQLGDKLPSPLEIPIMSLKGDESAEVISHEMAKASTAKALIHCDMAVVSNLLMLGSSQSFYKCSAHGLAVI